MLRAESTATATLMGPALRHGAPATRTTWGTVQSSHVPLPPPRSSFIHCPFSDKKVLSFQGLQLLG